MRFPQQIRSFSELLRIVKKTENAKPMELVRGDTIENKHPKNKGYFNTTLEEFKRCKIKKKRGEGIEVFVNQTIRNEY